MFDSCYDRLAEPDFLLRQWSVLCISQMWDSNDKIKVYGVDEETQDKLIGLLSDESPEVRAAALFSLGTFMGASGSTDKSKMGGGGSGTMFHLEERTHFRMEVAVATGATLAIRRMRAPLQGRSFLSLSAASLRNGGVILSFAPGSIGRKTERGSWKG